MRTEGGPRVATSAALRPESLYNSTVKPILITRHARNRMRGRRRGEDLVRDALFAPDWEEPSAFGRRSRSSPSKASAPD
jgi:hypothetical protein